MSQTVASHGQEPVQPRLRPDRREVRSVAGVAAERGDGRGVHHEVADAYADPRRGARGREHAVRQVVEVVRRAGRSSYPAHSSPSSTRSSCASSTLHDPKEVNQRLVRAASSGSAESRSASAAPSVCSSTCGHVVRGAAVERGARGQQHVEEAVVLEAGLLVAVPHRVVQPGRALERQLAVEGRLDAGGELAQRSGTGPADAPPVRNFRWISRAASSSRAASQPCDGLPGGIGGSANTATSSSCSLERVDDLDQPLRVVGEVLLVAQRELDGAQRQALRAGHPGDRRLDRAGAAGDDEVDAQWSRLTLAGARCSTTDGEVGDLDVADHEAADQVGVLLVAVVHVVGDGLLERGVARREDRGVVHEAVQEGRNRHGCHAR